MAEPESTLSNDEIVDEVRTALAGIDSSSIPDDTIVQAKNRFVVPLLQDLASPNVDQKQFDNAVIAYTAEKSFDAWFNFTRLRDSDLEAYQNPEQYKEKLIERTNNALFVINVTRPPEVPNTVVTVTLDDKQEKVPLESNPALLGQAGSSRGFF